MQPVAHPTPPHPLTDAATLRVTTHDDPTAAGLAAALVVVDAGLGDANAAAAPLHDVRPLVCMAWPSPGGDTEGAGTPAIGGAIGGIVGRTWGSCCELQQLWVDPAWRRRGIGARLVRAFEARARARGCTTVYLDTFSFQAPGLYRALGYAVRLSIEGFAPGIVKHTMVRTLP